MISPRGLGGSATAAAAVAALAIAGCARGSAAQESAAEAHAPDPPIRNVVLAVVDTLRADHLSCYGYGRQTSPNLDRFAQAGVRFERAYTAWPETCPAMAAMLSGMWSQTNGVVLDTPAPVSRKLDMLPEILQRAGWKTAAFVMNSVLPRSAHYDQGFDRYVEAWNKEDNPKRRPEMELACAWMKEHAAEPFFLWVHCIEPHAPYQGKDPERFVGDAQYDPTRRVDVRPPERRFDALGGIPGFSRIEGRDELAYYVARYDSDVFDADAKFGQLLAQIDQLGIADQTAVIFVADHGEGFGEHDYFWHGYVPFDETTHVPLVIRAPGVAAGVASDVVTTVDVTPTVLDLLRLPVPPACEGRSLIPVLRNPAAPTSRVVFTESGDDRRQRSWQRSVRDRRFKLVYTPSEKEREQLGLEEWSLFDMADDDAETKNVIAGHPDVAERLKAELYGWMRSESLFEAPAASYSDAERAAMDKLGYTSGSPEDGEKPKPEKPKDGIPKDERDDDR